MEKLLELLNEYWKWYFELDDEWWIVDGNQDTLSVTSSYITMQIISKKFWFIKRLLKNDKIDLLKLTCMYTIYTEILDSDFSWEDRIIMILSIQDNPIEDLISYLK